MPIWPALPTSAFRAVDRSRERMQRFPNTYVWALLFRISSKKSCPCSPCVSIDHMKNPSQLANLGQSSALTGSPRTEAGQVAPSRLHFCYRHSSTSTSTGIAIIRDGWNWNGIKDGKGMRSWGLFSNCQVRDYYQETRGHC